MGPENMPKMYIWFFNQDSRVIGSSYLIMNNHIVASGALATFILITSILTIEMTIAHKNRMDSCFFITAHEVALESPFLLKSLTKTCIKQG